MPTDAPFWADVELAPTEPLRVEVDATPIGSDGVYLRGRIHAALAGHCRRCLDDVAVVVDEPIEVMFDRGSDDPETYTLPERGQVLDLAEPIREALLLAVPTHVECREDCRGLCAHCGTNLNHGECGCAPEERDEGPWAALRKLQFPDESHTTE